ncbi:LysR family transcriptional regulator [Paenibacillus agaridevorans]|uniref:LysR family transcriptional regulator n=1 Tax=Paenibacillus agaridevorans TaxID=171404 RepID=A0A2R5EX12_9BACL|nr:LysR family transcriptional regulator [Paenibacillus agaridevorans]GBG10675.1 LysR family transcriptional regulator [Paenibacillus agaridevorans]
MINLEWYRVFYWIARTGSLTKAALRLHITQPAVSQTIKQLENALGGPLFFRTSRGVTLTNEGAILYRQLEQAFAAIEVGEKSIADMNRLHSGEITIGASDTLCKHYLLPYLEMFHERYPGVRIGVTNRTTPETLALLKEGRIDFGIVSLPASDPAIHFKSSVPLQDCLVGGKKYAELAAGPPLTLEALDGLPLLMLEEGSSTRRFLDAYASGHGISLQPEFELGSVDLLVQFAQSGFGAAFVIRDYVKKELESGSLVEIPLQLPLPSRHIGIATLRGVPLSSAGKTFLDMLP